MLIDIWWWITLKIWHFFPTSAVLQFQVICCISFLCQINLSNPCTIKNVCTIWNEGFLWSITKASDYISRHWFRTERYCSSRYHTEFLSSVSLATEQVSKTKSIIYDLIYFSADSSVFFGEHTTLNFWEPAIYFAFLPNHPLHLLPLLPPKKALLAWYIRWLSTNGLEYTNLRLWGPGQGALWYLGCLPKLTICQLGKDFVNFALKWRQLSDWSTEHCTVCLTNSCKTKMQLPQVPELLPPALPRHQGLPLCPRASPQWSQPRM